VYRDTWIKQVNKIIDYYLSTLLIHQEFENDIKDILLHPACPLTGLLYEIKCPKPFKNFKIGLKGEGDPQINTHQINDSRKIICAIKIWQKSKMEIKADINELLYNLFIAFWIPKYRTRSAGLIDLKRSDEVIKFAQNKLAKMIEQKSISSVLFCDLDNFKDVNEKINHETGDRVIKEFGALLEEVTRKYAIPLHNGGDEFVIFYPRGNHENALQLAYDIKQKIECHDFQTAGISLSVSIGIAINDRLDRESLITNLFKLSEEALKKEVKDKKKGFARFYSKKQSIFPIVEIDKSLKIAFCITKSNALTSCIFNNVWLNTLSIYVSNEINNNNPSLSTIESSIDKFLNWANFNYNNKILKTSLVCSSERDISPEVSFLDITLAIFHGVMHSMLSKSSTDNNIKLKIRYDKEAKNVFLLLSPDIVLWSNGKVENCTKIFDLGTIWTSRIIKNINWESLRRAILIKIGHEDLVLPRELFSEIIVVDDRPTRGGGLPDFWEATIARLIAILKKNPNISFVFVTGEKQYGEKTINILGKAPDWDYEFIQDKTGMPFLTVKEASNRLKNILEIVDKDEDITPRLASRLRNYYRPKPTSKESLIGEERRFLEREIQMEPVVLKKEDGCRIGTIKKAFPLVLEIARSIKEKTIIRDQAGLELLELVDFKVHLDNPLSDRIPDFYTKEEESLQNYFKKEFCSPEGLFGRSLIKTDQLNKVINHLIQAITNTPNPYATRRAILIIPHKMKNGKELTPLGLISIRCIPRITPKTIILNYSYTWRTVEALVGFPYSIYGSVCFSEFMTKEIIKKLRGELQNRVKMGFVSYIAHSLHIVMDEYGQNITKKIVDDASK